MIVVRNVFHAKYGHGNELVEMFKELNQKSDGAFKGRLLTDLSGTFFTVVSEQVYDSLSDHERTLAEAFDQPWFQEWFSRMQPLVESGSREFYTVAAELD